MSENDEKINKKISYKIILIGDSLVGKTCLFKKITKGTYSTKNISTIGMDQKSLSKKVIVPEDPNNESSPEIEKDFSIHLWDTAGQERFRSITAGYFKQSHGLILLYDITNRASFDNLEKWILAVTNVLGQAEQGENNKKHYAVILLGNKADLEDKRKVTYEEAEDVCKQFNIYWGGECSVQEMTKEELDDKFKEIIKEIYRNIGTGEDSGQIVRKLSTGQKQKKKKDQCICN